MTSSSLSQPQKIEALLKLKRDFRLHAETCLKLKAKDGSLKPFKLNQVQDYVHDRLEEQRLSTGKVRALILKARQQGISTYISARYYSKATMNTGRSVFILTHEDKATQNLFDMAKRYNDNNPIAPSTKNDNAKELSFAALDSGYGVGTAGAKAVGRSKTIQMLHGCLSPDTWVIEPNGNARRMGDFEVGDSIVTHTGAVAQISYISHKEKEAFRVKLLSSSDEVIATGEHKFLTPNGKVKLRDLRVGDFMLYPVCALGNKQISWPYRLNYGRVSGRGGSGSIGPDTVDADFNLGRVLGLYLAEGSLGKNRVGFTIHEREVARTIEWLLPFSHLWKKVCVRPRQGSKTVTIEVNSKSFCEFVKARCGSVDGKALPAEWRDNADFSHGLVVGYFSGDGGGDFNNTRRVSAPSIRSAITFGMRDALAALGYGWASIARKDAGIRHGRLEREQWTIRVAGAGADRLWVEMGRELPPRLRTARTPKVQIIDGYAHIPIVGISDNGITDVMDFEVDHNDHSYCIWQCASSNSEAAFWPNAASHFSGVVQAVPDLPDTEIILESTANGVGGEFHERWQMAERGEGDYIAIFIPWFWSTEYQRPVPDGFQPSIEEVAEQRLYDLTDEQLVWRRAKIAELKDPLLFKQEYPATAAEAFQMTGHDSFIKPEAILKARKNKVDGIGPLVIGADPARFGDDLFALAWRRGRKVEKTESKPKTDVVEGANWIRMVIDTDHPDAVFIDAGGVGGGVYDMLKNWGKPYSDVVRAVNFGSPAHFPKTVGSDGKYLPGPANRRAEMWENSKDWLDDVAGVDIPDMDVLQADACGPSYRYNTNQELVLESKEDMRKRGVKSPDYWDAIALTFAEPVKVRNSTPQDRYAKKAQRKSAWVM